MPHIDTKGQGVGGGGPRPGNWGPSSHGNKSEGSCCESEELGRDWMQGLQATDSSRQTPD